MNSVGTSSKSVAFVNPGYLGKAGVFFLQIDMRATTSYQDGRVLIVARGPPLGAYLKLINMYRKSGHVVEYLDATAPRSAVKVFIYPMNHPESVPSELTKKLDDIARVQEPLTHCMQAMSRSLKREVTRGSRKYITVN